MGTLVAAKRANLKIRHYDGIYESKDARKDAGLKPGATHRKVVERLVEATPLHAHPIREETQLLARAGHGDSVK